MLTLSYVLLTVHFFLLGVLCLFGLHRLSMVWRWWRYRKTITVKPDVFTSLPKVTIQIPLYNEKWVVERIIHAASQIDYPHDKLQIQIVDDSTDDTSQLIEQGIKQYVDQGINFQHIRRTDREGYKAGALKSAMAFSSGEFIAIFDADFIPYPSIIKDTIDHFNDEKVAMVQFRWEHLNRFNSQLTEAQAMMLDAHFCLEQQVRYSSGVLFNFNGTAGIWRAEAIIDAGHWSADTLTEDLDLSYRAQLKGWKLVYLNDIACAGELPADMNAFKSQQHRWAKGGIQVMKKMLLTVWRSPLSFWHKLESTFHLTNNLAYLVMLVDTLFFLVPSLVIREHYQIVNVLWVDFPLLLLASGGHLIYFYFGQVAQGHSKWRALKNMPRVLLLGVQLAFNNARAAIEALIGQQSEFIRTPKSGDRKCLDKGLIKGMSLTHTSHSNLNTPSLDKKNLYQTVTPQGGGFELLLGLVYSFVFIWAINNELWLMLPFLLLLIVGFISTSVNTLILQRKKI